MAAENIYQLYLTNPITTNQSLDLMYFGRSPYGVTNDGVMTFANFQAQFIAPGLAGQIGYYASNGYLISPANLVAGAGISITLSGNNYTIGIGGGGGIVGSVQGTANQVIVNGTTGTPETGTIVLTAPQNLNTTAAFQVNTLQFNSNNGILDSNGNEMLALNPAVTPVNYLSIGNAATGNSPAFGVSGADVNIGIAFNTKGTGGYAFNVGTNMVLALNTIASSVNYLEGNGNTTGNPCQIGVAGTDSNIGLTIFAKGTGQLLFDSINTSPIVIASGTALQHQTVLAFANTNVIRTLTFPDVSGTVAIQTNSDTSWTPSFTFATPGDLALGSVTAVGQYTQIGNMVYFSCYYTASLTFTTASGAAFITGLPATVNNTANTGIFCVASATGTGVSIPANTVGTSGLCVPNTTTIELYGLGTGTHANAAYTTSNFTTTDVVTINISGFYFV